MCILILAVEVSGDQLSLVNVAGLSLCLLGIIGHIVHKVGGGAFVYARTEGGAGASAGAAHSTNHATLN